MQIEGTASYTPVNKSGTPKKSGDLLNMDDFFKLLVAQLSNQDMFNTVDDTQFISQMAQFSMVQALSEMSKASATAYSMSLIGKEATIAVPQDDGTILAKTGIVDSVILYGGSPELEIDGERYKLNSVMEVRTPNIILPNNRIEQNPIVHKEAGDVE